MPITAKLDQLGKPAWIALMIAGFIIWWPVGLATLAFRAVVHRIVARAPDGAAPAVVPPAAAAVSRRRAAVPDGP